MLLLDVTETADLFRDRGERDRDVMVVRRQTRQNLVEHRLVVADQLALGTPFQRTSERIERRPAQALEFRQQPERRQYPGAEAHFARQARGLVAARQQRRRQMKFEAQIVPVEFGLDLFEE